MSSATNRRALAFAIALAGAAAGAAALAFVAGGALALLVAGLLTLAADRAEAADYE